MPSNKNVEKPCPKSPSTNARKPCSYKFMDSLELNQNMELNTTEECNLSFELLFNWEDEQEKHNMELTDLTATEENADSHNQTKEETNPENIGAGNLRQEATTNIMPVDQYSVSAWF